MTSSTTQAVYVRLVQDGAQAFGLPDESAVFSVGVPNELDISALEAELPGHGIAVIRHGDSGAHKHLFVSTMLLGRPFLQPLRDAVIGLPGFDVSELDVSPAAAAADAVDPADSPATYRLNISGDGLTVRFEQELSGAGQWAIASRFAPNDHAELAGVVAARGEVFFQMDQGVDGHDRQEFIVRLTGWLEARGWQIATQPA